jgi:hypothetical protein
MDKPFNELRQEALASLGDYPSLSRFPVGTSGPIYPGLMTCSAGDDDSVPFEKLVGVTADGRIFDISGDVDGCLKCSRCQGALLQNFQHDYDDCFTLNKHRLFEVRSAFLRWAVVRSNFTLLPDVEYPNVGLDCLERLLDRLGTSVGEVDDWNSLRASVSNLLSTERDRPATMSYLAFGERIIRYLNDCLTSMPDSRKSQVCATSSPPSADISKALEELQLLRDRQSTYFVFLNNKLSNY